ncbi:MAG TPA: EthD family reductase [Phenylobacterium sp.]|uniref:EthD family reductase n=1 Tax=Phenylobacterium sp. TaxID=1871053 RepID=UPI002B49E80D|nr:EthD family reductase [Phenylobacterium sp.]HKR86856.1 EthD family reductase [Phenylobacterium sp.]
MIALYKTPEDADAFFAHYREVHIPLVRKLPGLAKVEITQINKTLLGEKGNFLLAEMTFTDPEAFQAAMRSPENAAAGADAVAFAGELVTVMTGETLEI